MKQYEQEAKEPMVEGARRAGLSGSFRPSRFKAPFNVYLPFVPRAIEEIDPLIKGGLDPVYKGHVFDFVLLNLPFRNPFQNQEPLGVTLRAGMKKVRTEYAPLREVIYRLAKENRSLFNVASKEQIGSTEKVGMLSYRLCTGEDFQRLPLNEVKEKIASRFRRFFEGPYFAILDILRSPSVTMFNPAREP